ncbi:MAG: ABC transporter permease, partial [Chloroflexi bacterium]|nr:ABC transporter permease [Chloroflexota bacterium]
MSRPSVFLKAMRDQLWMVLGFGLGGALMAALVLGVYPSYREALAHVELPPALQALVGDVDLASAEGFLSAEFFSWIPALLIVYAIIQGTGALAGEESNGTLDLLLAQPISRTRLFIEKAMSIVVGTLAIVALILPGWVIVYAAAGIDVALGRLLVATVAMAPLMLAFAALSLLAGSLLPTRRDAATAVVAVAVISFFVNSLGQAADVLEPLRPASLFFYFRTENVLVAGVDPAGAGMLLAVAVGAGCLAPAVF